jgi:hypothetical protein
MYMLSLLNPLTCELYNFASIPSKITQPSANQLHFQ